jgi:hypothetical protein
VFAPGKSFQPSLLLVGKARSLPSSGAPERCFTWVSSCPTSKLFTIMERLARDEHFSLLQKVVNHGRKVIGIVLSLLCIIFECLRG